MIYDTFDSEFGKILVVQSEEGISQVSIVNESNPFQVDELWDHVPGSADNVKAQLEAYFKGELQEFDLPLNPEGSEFQLKVWKELLKIPYGTTITYGVLAKRLGDPKASRAVGLANGKNPIWIIIPCHRVIGANGKLTGYAGGLDVKLRLLQLEGAVFA